MILTLHATGNAATETMARTRGVRTLQMRCRIALVLQGQPDLIPGTGDRLEVADVSQP